MRAEEEEITDDRAGSQLSSQHADWDLSLSPKYLEIFSKLTVSIGNAHIIVSGSLSDLI